MTKIYSVLTIERETILKIKTISTDNKLPRGLLIEGSKAIKDHLKKFEEASKLDAAFEKRPAKR